MLLPIVAGTEEVCFAVTEPNAGLETARANDLRRGAATTSRRRQIGFPPRKSPTRC